MEQETEKILENIRSKRLERKVSLLNLAVRAGISHSHLYLHEQYTPKRIRPTCLHYRPISCSLSSFCGVFFLHFGKIIYIIQFH